MVFSVAAVSANEIDNNYVTESSDSLSIGDSFLGSSEIQDSNCLAASTGSFDDLQVEINNAPSGSVLNLTRDYNGAYGSRIQFNKDLTIDGQGHTLDCLNTECTAFYSSSGNITLINLKIINGHNDDNYNGGAIHIEGSAQYTLINCTFTNNWADDYGGAVYNGVNKPLNVINCTFNKNEADDYNGGAIYSVGEVYLENSRFESNLACLCGGAVYSEKTVNINKSLFKSNKVSGTSMYPIYGGAVYSKEVNIDNSTFEDNHADDNGGAIYAEILNINTNQNKTQSFNSFFINNNAGEYGGAVHGVGLVANIFNTAFIGNVVGRVGGAIDVEGANLVHCLFKSNTASELSQESLGGAVHCGLTLNVDNCTFEDNFAYDHGGAISAMNVNINVNQEPGQPYSTFFINNKAYDNDGGAVHVHGGIVKVVNTVFSGNSAERNGGVIDGDKDIYTDNCLFQSNSASGDDEQCKGGVIYTSFGNVYINNSTFKDNYAYDYGGAVYANYIYVNNDQNSTDPYNSFFINNKAGDNDGGALYSYYDLHVKNAVFSGNSAYEDGGAIFCCDNAYVTHSLFESNKADGAKAAQSEGGAIHCKDDLTVESSVFNNNFAYDYGGAIYADTLALRSNCIFDSNTAYDNQGGAIWVNKFREDVSYATFINNKAGEGSKDDGGAIYIDDENWETFSQCVFASNHCNGEGGAIYLDSSSAHLTLRNNIFVANTAGEGQVVYNCGVFDSITDNWWGGNNPSSSNDQLIEWKPWPWSNVHHSDSKPLDLRIVLYDNPCGVDSRVWVGACFYRNDGYLCSGVMRTDYISFVPITGVEFLDRIDNDYYVNSLISVHKAGLYPITVNLFGLFSTGILTVSDGPVFTDSNPSNSPNPPVYLPDAPVNEYRAVNVRYVGVNNVNTNTNLLDVNSDVNDTNVTNSTDKTPDNASVAKTTNNQSNGGFNYLWIVLALVIVAGAAVLIKKYKN